MHCTFATNQYELNEVYKLTHNVYVKQGYCQPQVDGMLKHYPHLDGIPQTKVIIAVEDGKVVGTNSWTADGPRKLHVDQDFPEEVDEIRKRCQQKYYLLAASWRIITSPTARNSLKIILEVINYSMRSLLVYKPEVTLFSFNPRHGKMYTRLLGLETIAERTCHAIGGAPAILMRGDFDTMVEAWTKTCEKRGLEFNP